MARLKGKIKNFYSDKKFGFISVEGKNDIFFHINEFTGDRSKIKPGLEVEFDEGVNPKNTKSEAKNVSILGEGITTAKPHNQNLNQPNKVKRYLIPKDTAKILNENRDLVKSKNPNFNSLLNKLIPAEGLDIIKIKDVKVLIGNFDTPAELKEYYETAAKFYENVFSLEKKISWRLAIGLGKESVYETSLNLHHIYGVPYIPGQSLKGAVRSYVINSKFSGDEKMAFQDLEFCKIFGCPKESVLKKEHKGSIIFFDAFPAGDFDITLDIMNPHYQPYYSDTTGSTPPADYYDPVPVNFLTVKNTTFCFLVAAENRKNESKNESNNEYLEKVKDYLNEALENSGLGAKTSVGYGFFE